MDFLLFRADLCYSIEMQLNRESIRDRIRGFTGGEKGLFKNSGASAFRLIAHLYICRMKILMVCLGNICRSPLAEGILQKKAADADLEWQVESAGTNQYHIGEAPHPLSQKVAQMNGIDIRNQRARRFVAADFDRYDKIYALAEDVLEEIKRIAKDNYDPAKAALLMNELYPGENRNIPDPWYGPEPGYHEVYGMLDRVCSAVIRKYAK
ncbi:MAG TPA: low molecular weight protein-tyrosine-phosphatase [Chitinophagaceae bacterium]|nr:low molecular weight protein-tyrosine-phosphatase [Chitinophagaceae bacterium]